MNNIKTFLFLIMLTCCLHPCLAQKEATIQWLTFEQLEDSLKKQPKKVFIDFYTDWCTYCKKMDKEVFTQPQVADALNGDFYAVKMDAESRDLVKFDGHIFSNKMATKKREGVHELALLLGQRKGQFSPPAMLLLNEDFNVLDRKFEYLHSKKLLHWLKEFQ